MHASLPPSGRGEEWGAARRRTLPPPEPRQRLGSGAAAQMPPMPRHPPLLPPAAARAREGAGWRPAAWQMHRLCGSAPALPPPLTASGRPCRRPGRAAYRRCSVECNCGRNLGRGMSWCHHLEDGGGRTRRIARTTARPWETPPRWHTGMTVRSLDVRQPHQLAVQDAADADGVGLFRRPGAQGVPGTLAPEGRAQRDQRQHVALPRCSVLAATGFRLPRRLP